MVNSVARASIIIEWYNMTHAQLERPRRMLAALKAQARAMRSNFELIIAHRGDERAVTQVCELLNQLDPSDEFAIRITTVPGGTYCELKNAGAAAASCEIVIFLDCDVIPEPGWLTAMLGAFDKPDVYAAVGNTYTDYSDGRAYSKAMALAWMFPLRQADDRLDVSRWFYANNAAFRRAIFLERRFPITPGLIHYPAQLLVERLERDGITLWHVGGARVSHPPPNGARHFVNRALAAGRARAFSETISSRSALAYVGADLRSIVWYGKRVATAGGSVDLGWWQVPAAITYATSYHLLVLGGYLFTLAAPKLMRHRFDF